MVVVPFFMSGCRRTRGALDRPTIVFLMGLADALFPLVALVCARTAGPDGDGGVYQDKMYRQTKCHTSRYFWLGCAAEAGSGRCVDWIMGRRGGGKNIEKECLAVLGGLCRGGHLEMAQQMVRSGEDSTQQPSPPGGRGVRLMWPSGSYRPDRMMMRNLLTEACLGGNLECVKWLTSQFGVTSGWEFVRPFSATLVEGHIDILRWMVQHTDVVELYRKLKTVAKVRRPPRLGFNAFQSGNVEVVALWNDLFNQNGFSFGMPYLVDFANGTNVKGPQLRESLEWIKNRMDEKPCVVEDLLGHIECTEALQWITAAFSIEPTKGTLDLVCQECADVESIQWLVSTFSSSIGPIGGDSFAKACGNKKDSVEVLKSLILASPHLGKTGNDPTNKVDCLAEALVHNNTAVADWLEDTFHVMDTVNSNPALTEEMLLSIVGKELWFDQRCLRGVEWFFSRVSLRNLGESSVAEAIDTSLHYNLDLALLIAKIFGNNVKPHPSRCHKALRHAIRYHGLSDVKKLFPWLKGLGSASVVTSLAEDRLYRVQSGKAVKWLIQQLNMTEQDVKLSDNYLLFTLIHTGKKKCAEWLITQFNITLSEVAKMVDSRCKVIEPEMRTNLGTWKMLLRVYPEMTADLVRQHFMAIATVTPLHIETTMKLLGVTVQDVAEYFQRDDVWSISETCCLWACSALPSIASSFDSTNRSGCL
ncbi:hypothetical protein Pelo_15998 [Pelomyxa schiedti]|nr:hypothetical protein Pelo_15998 [Pelomyxa schiedti]